MGFPGSPYIEEREAGLYLAGTRISLDSVVIAFQDGSSPESIAESFPTLKLAQVYGAIAYFLKNEELVREYIAQGERELRRGVPPLSQTNPELFRRLGAARHKTSPKPG